MSEKLMSIDQMLKKVKELKKENSLDLSSDQDLSIAIMNLISIEEHFFFTGAKTGNPKYYDLLAEVREIRKNLLKKIIKEYEGEVWCISKHLLAASYRLMEVGTKAQGKGQKDEAEEMFQKSYELYSLFWGLNLDLVQLGDVKKIADSALNVHDQQNQKNEAADLQKDSESSEINSSEKSLSGKLGALVKKVINCCLE